MTLLAKYWLLCLMVTMSLAVAAAAAPAPDKASILKERQATMKQQAKDLGQVKGYLDGKADQATALTGATSLTETTRKIPSLFPPGTEGTSPDGDFRPKPVVWTDHDKFLDAQKNAAAKADALLAAVKTDNKPRIRAAFVDLGKNGCGNCHQTFREKLKP
ncbi:MAG: c-type cytochrome [Stellaceae bacterium]